MANVQMRGDTEFLAFRPELWSPLLFPTLLENLTYSDTVARDYQGAINQIGDRVHITEAPQFDEANEISEGQKNDAVGITLLGQELVIDREIVVDYIVTKRAKLQTLESANALRDLAMFAIMKRLNKIIIEATVPSAAAPDHQIPYDSGTTLNLADWLEAKELLDAALVPEAPFRCANLDSPQWNDTFNIVGFTSSDFVSSRPNESGQPPVQIFGFRPKMSTENEGVSRFYHPQYMNVAVQDGLNVEMFNRGVDGIRDERINVGMLMGRQQTSDIRVVSIS